ncbi:unnamed protein product [Thelazia callipaeda]|uniref:DUF4515 domain-containing protein n=1 Tax=Thelazia callipaeda TaxID=103827 RepID=A0A0N5D2E7_THECL|nr:unnamed protein product [Thelazia callipaeda]
MSDMTGFTNGQSPEAKDQVRTECSSLNSNSTHDKSTHLTNLSGPEKSDLPKPLKKISSLVVRSVDMASDMISDNELISLYEKRATLSSDKYESILKKAVALLKDKSRIEEEAKRLRASNESLQQMNKDIREKSVRLHAKAEQEEEYISNMLLKRIQKLKNDKEALALKYEQEEEFLTNDLSRKLSQLQNERDELAGQIEAEQSWVVDTLLVKIRKLEAEISANHLALEQLRREKVDLENALEHEQESLFNTLGKRMDQLEAEKRRMQARIDQASLSETHSAATASELSAHEMNEIGERRSSRAETESRKLREECSRLRVVVMNLKNTVSNLQERVRNQETKYVADLLAIREKSAGMRADNRRVRVALETDLARCLETCRAFTASEMVRENDEDNCMAALLSRMSVPKSITPTPIFNPNSGVISTDTSSSVSWSAERAPPARIELQGDKMDEGPEIPDGDGDGDGNGDGDGDGDINMDADFCERKRRTLRIDNNKIFNEKVDSETSVFPDSISPASDDSNDVMEIANAGGNQFVRPTLPPARSPVLKRNF